MLTRLRRVKQWQTFTRTWWLYDAKWQDPFDSGLLISRYLSGKQKPIWHPDLDCGDHVVVINAAHVALPNQEWKWRFFFHHTQYAGGAKWASAWSLHQKDPTFVLERAIYKSCRYNKDSIRRKEFFARLMMFRDEKMPEEIKQNITAQIRQLRVVPKKIEECTPEELDKFPKVFDYNPDFRLDQDN